MAQKHIEGSDDPAQWNQAMMELGARICLAASPRCDSCPVASDCLSAFQVEVAAEKKKRVRPVLDLHWRVELYICSKRGIWLQQRPDEGIWAGLWTPPMTEMDAAPAHPPCYIHLLTHRRLHLYAEQRTGDTPSADGAWVADTAALALPTGIRKLFAIHGVEQ